MYPDLSYLLHDLIGTEPDNWTSIVKTFGLMLAIAILTAAFLFSMEIKRKEKEGLLQASTGERIVGLPAQPFELIMNAILGFILGSKLIYIFNHFEEFKIDAADVIFSSKGNLIAGIIGAIFLAGMKYLEKNKEKKDKPVTEAYKIYPHEMVGDFTIVAAVSGIAGAKIFAIIEELDSFYQDPFGTFFSGSGMAIYGGLIGGFIGGVIYLKRKKIPVLPILDAAAPILIIAYGIGRLGCQLSGDGDWGIVNDMPKPSWFIFPDWAWAFDFPHNVLSDGIPIEGCEWKYCHKLSQPVWPTSIYETIMGLGIGGIIWGIRKRITIPGMLFCIYLIFNGFERFWIEKVRVNDRYQVLGIQSTQAEFIAVCLMLIGIGGVIYFWQKNKKKLA